MRTAIGEHLERFSSNDGKFHGDALIVNHRIQVMVDNKTLVGRTWDDPDDHCVFGQNLKGIQRAKRNTPNIGAPA